MELLSNYDIDIQYHLGKANKAIDVLSQKTYDILIVMRMLPRELAREIKDYEIAIVHEKMINLKVRLIILEDIRKAQKEGEYLAKARKFNKEAKKDEITVAFDGLRVEFTC